MTYCKSIKPVFSAALIFSTVTVFSQAEKKQIRDGNKKYKEEKYDEAQTNYQKAIEINNESFHGKFNLADAMYRQKKYEDAAQQFGAIASKEQDKLLKAQAYHNLGNSLLQSKKVKESVDAYKNALRYNPKDEDTRFNLAYAMQMMQQEQQQQQNKENKDKNDEKKDQSQDKQNQQKEQEKKEEQQQQEKQQQEKKSKEQQQQEQQQRAQQKNQLSKEDAKRLLEALNNEEQKVQEKLKHEKIKGTRVQVEKDW